MAEARAGVVGSVEINSMSTPTGGGTGVKDFFNPSDGSTWSLVWFLIVVFLLFIM